MLKNALLGRLPEEELRQLWSAFDVIGDIAVVRIPDSLYPKRHLVADVILKNLRRVKSVYAQVGKVDGVLRLRKLEWLGGIQKTDTVHKEHGCRFHLDVSKVYFTPRLSHERLIVAKMVQPGEVVVNMFGGVAPFSVLIAKLQETAKIYSIDLNPDAYAFAVENVKLNKVVDRVIPILGDSKEVVRHSLRGEADRVLLPLPEDSHRYLEDALRYLKPNDGTVHYYRHIRAPSRISAVEVASSEVSEIIGSKWDLQSNRIVREVGPRWFEVVLDFHCEGLAE